MFNNSSVLHRFIDIICLPVNAFNERQWSFYVFYLLCHLFPRLKEPKLFMFSCMSCFLDQWLFLPPFGTFHSRSLMDFDAKTEHSIPVEALILLKLLDFISIFYSSSPSFEHAFYYELASLEINN